MFPGQYYDKETGYLYNYYRTYDPQIGYLQADPRGILLDFSDPQRQIASMMGVVAQSLVAQGYLNRNYVYADQNPINKIDPTGENATNYFSSFRGYLHNGFGKDPVKAIVDEAKALDRNTCELQCLAPQIDDVVISRGVSEVGKSLGVLGKYAASRANAIYAVYDVTRCISECLEDEECRK